MRTKVQVLQWMVSACALAGSILVVPPLLAQNLNATEALPVKKEAPKDARSAAPFDVTGYWVSVITEDWRWRMVTPAKGDFASVPLNQHGKDTMDQWDTAKDTAAGEQCRSYGAAAIMRVPEHLKISWQDADTLTVDTDAGQQLRVLHFKGQLDPQAAPSWQGYSAASWDDGTLKAITTHLKAGYLRKNGVPYSDQAVVTEYWDHEIVPTGAEWLVLTIQVDDPTYLFQPYVTSPNFRRQQVGTNWSPEPCSATW